MRGSSVSVNARDEDDEERLQHECVNAREEDNEEEEEEERLQRECERAGG